MIIQSAGGDQAAACLFCGRRVAWIERRCPAFALAGVAAHAGCCGGWTTTPAEHKRASNSATG
jgi:hypothetical protein